MGRAGGDRGFELPETGFAADPLIPRNIVRKLYVCSQCSNASTYDSIGGEWCSECETAEHLVKEERLFKIVDIRELAPDNAVTFAVTFCNHCGDPSSFDGQGGEWCAGCQTAETIVTVDHLYEPLSIAF